MAEACLNLSCPEVLRFSLMDPCTGEPIPGAANGYALSCPRNLTLEPIIREGETSEFVSDCGYVVVRDRQDDQLQGWTVSFEHGTRSNELEALLTGKTLITSGGENIGTYQQNLLGCPTGAAAADPRFIVELFYKVSRCTSGADHVRFVIPNVQFKITEMDKEGQITFFRFNGESSPSLAAPIGDGPYNDFPVDVATFIGARPAGELTTNFDFEETITIVGSCGTIEVLGDGPGFFLLSNGGTASNGGVDIVEGSLLVASVVDDGGGQAAIGVYKFLNNGNPDTSFGVGGLVTVPTATVNDPPQALRVASDGSIYVLAALNLSGSYDIAAIKLTPAGALDAGFGVGGIKTLQPASGGYPAHRALHIESTGNIVAGYSTSAGAFKVHRFDSTGADIDFVTGAGQLWGMRSAGADGVYVGVGFSSPNGLVFNININTTTVLTGNIGVFGVDISGGVTNGGGSLLSISTNASGDIFVGAINPIGGHARVVKTDSALVLDTSFGGDGYVDIQDGSWISSDVRTTEELPGGDIIVTGRATTGGGLPMYTARLDPSGNLVGSYGTAGIETYTLPGSTQVFIDASIQLSGGAKIVHAGKSDTGNETIIVRTLTADGALDTSFG